MKPNSKFLNCPKSFWALVRTISQDFGYTQRGHAKVSAPNVNDMIRSVEKNGLTSSCLVSNIGRSTKYGKLLCDYFRYRADKLNNYVEPRLMDISRARKEFKRLKKELLPKGPVPMNKQKGAKKVEAYLTGLVNMIIEANSKGFSCVCNPLRLTTVTRDGYPLRTLARRIDGAFPSVVNPIAIWEIKEYYHTTTFGSRVADGVYETLLDGMELAELKEHEGIHILHYLIIDAYYTWWECGRSYLCRIFDALHMGYIDEVLFGYEVIERLPNIVKQWVRIAKKNR